MARSRSPLTLDDVPGLAWDKGAGGLLPAVVQDAATRQVLMLAWVDEAAVRETLSGGRATFHSRSRGGRWLKGETSGNTLAVTRVLTDCDGDALLIEATPAGPACHENTTSCFGDEAVPGLGFLGALERIIEERRRADPSESYTARLLSGDPRRMAQKVGEEGLETALAAAAGPDEEVLSEAADLLFHLTVLLAGRRLALNDVVDVLRARHAAPKEASDG